MTRPAIVSFAYGGWYPRGLQRLKASCQRFDVQLYGYETYPAFCPSHQDVPYAFKLYTMQIVAVTNPVMLWLDASGWLQHHPQAIFDHIEQHGYLILDNEHPNSTWCSDRQLEAFGYTRDEAEIQHQVIGGCIGFDFRNQEAVSIFYEWMANIDLFRGRWDNKGHTESQDPRCAGSRHDQSVMSLIAAKRGLTITDPAPIVSFDPNNTEVPILMQGM